MEVSGSESFQYFWPEVALATTALAVAFLARLERLDRTGLGELAILGAAVSVFLAARLSGSDDVWIFERALVVDGFAIFFKVVIGLATVAVLWISLESPRSSAATEGRACALTLVAALALDVMVSAASLWIGYLAVEIASLALWSLLRAPGCATASVPLGVASFAASIGMLGGVAWVAGYCGSADYERVHRTLVEATSQGPLLLPLAAAAILVAFPSRVLIAASVPEAEDELSLDAFVAVAFTAAGIALSVRLLFGVLSEPVASGRWVHASGLDWSRLVAASSVGAMTIGNLGALRERSLRGLLVATSLAHVGYALAALVSATDRGLVAMLFYLAAFTPASLGAFHLAALVGRASGTEDLDSCSGLLRGRGSLAGAAMAVFLLSLAGIPLFVGFAAKVHLFAATWGGANGGLTALALFNYALSLFAYARVLCVMASAARERPAVRMSSYDACLTTSLACAVIAFGIYEAPLQDLAERSIHLLPR